MGRVYGHNTMADADGGMIRQISEAYTTLLPGMVLQNNWLPPLAVPEGPLSDLPLPRTDVKPPEALRRENRAKTLMVFRLRYVGSVFGWHVAGIQAGVMP